MTNIGFAHPLNEYSYFEFNNVSKTKLFIDNLVISSEPDDSDDDGLTDLWEMKFFGNLDQQPSDDADSDGLTNLQEKQQGGNPNNPDSDGDGMSDGWEFTNGLNLLDAADGESDSDADGLSNREEYIFGTNPGKQTNTGVVDFDVITPMNRQGGW